MSRAIPNTMSRQPGKKTGHTLLRAPGKGPMNMQDYTETTDGRKPLTDSALAEHADAIRALGKQTVANIIEIGRRLTA